MIYVDEIFVFVSRKPQARFVGTRTGHRWCHMWSDANDGGAELDAMALRLGMRVRWRHGDHYDLVPTKRAKALQLGAQEAPRGSPARRAWHERRRAARAAQRAAAAGREPFPAEDERWDAPEGAVLELDGGRGWYTRSSGTWYPISADEAARLLAGTK